MARNSFFNQYTPIKREQSLVEDLIIEAIKIYGVDAYYLPRTHVNLDKLYTEDASMLFDDALDMELYVKSFDGFQGAEDFLSKFGLQIDEQITFVVAQKRFDQALKECHLTEYGQNLVYEDGNDILKESTYDYSEILRPREGDLIWFPMAKYMFQIKFTENIENFFQLGKLYTYEMRCERFDYSNERLDTDIAEIDQLEEIFSQSTEFVDKVILEDDDVFLLSENDGYVVHEGIYIQEADNSAQNEFIQQRIIDDDILDFSESNPFAGVREF
jgi:hypothetical protein